MPPIDSNRMEHEIRHSDAEALWKVKFFYRTKYVEYEIQAPTERYANLFARRAAGEDGYDQRILQVVSCERIA